jgi:uncharacterized protein YjbI with pentapeptide repeats
MNIEIRHRYTNNVLYACDMDDLRSVVVKAVADGADLYGADLRGADLRGADLYGANLRGADLWGADLWGEKIAIAPVLIGGLRWTICISEGYLEIGCQRHSHGEWKAFSDDEIADMSDEALQFWQQWKKPLLDMCKTHRKESLAYRKANPEPVESPQPSVHESTNESKA